MKCLSLFILFLFTNIMFSQLNIDSVIVRNKVLEVRMFNSRDALVSVSKYDSIGRLVYNSKDNFIASIKTSETIFYNSIGKEIKTISTHSAYSEPMIWTKEYDNNNNLKSIKDENGSLVYEYFYDNSNFKIKELKYENGVVSDTITYEKIDNGKTIVEFMRGNFIKNRKNLTFFDDNNNEIRSESYDFEKLRYSSEKIYNENKIVKIIYNERRGKSGNNFYYDDKLRLHKRELFAIEEGKEIPNRSEVFEYYENDLFKTYTENVYNPRGEKFRFEYVFQK